MKSTLDTCLLLIFKWGMPGVAILSAIINGRGGVRTMPRKWAYLVCCLIIANVLWPKANYEFGTLEKSLEKRGPQMGGKQYRSMLIEQL